MTGTCIIIRAKKIGRVKLIFHMCSCYTSGQSEQIQVDVFMPNNPVTHTRRKAHALSDKN